MKMSSQPVKGIIRQVKPLLSIDHTESRRRVLNLYRAWYRTIPSTILWYNLPIGITQARALLKKNFMKHKDVTDIRVIDMLVIKGQMELKETVHRFKQECHCMYYVKDSTVPKPTDFLAKFLAGID